MISWVYKWPTAITSDELARHVVRAAAGWLDPARFSVKNLHPPMIPALIPISPAPSPFCVAPRVPKADDFFPALLVLNL